MEKSSPLPVSVVKSSLNDRVEAAMPNHNFRLDTSTSAVKSHRYGHWRRDFLNHDIRVEE